VALGDAVLLRHAKGGELAERFNEYLAGAGGPGDGARGDLPRPRVVLRVERPWVEAGARFDPSPGISPRQTTRASRPMGP